MAEGLRQPSLALIFGQMDNGGQTLLMGSDPICNSMAKGVRPLWCSLTLFGSGSAGHPSSFLGEFNVVGQSPAPRQCRQSTQVATPGQGVRPLLNTPDTKNALNSRI